MPAQNGPRQIVKDLVAKLNGSIWTSVTDMGAGGAATAKTKIESHRVPDAARTLLGWRPVEYAKDQAADESQVSVFDISGANYKFQPQEVICGNVAPSVMTTGGLLHAPSEYFDVFAPVSGGETIDISVEPVDAIAGNRDSGAELTWSDVRIPLPVIYSQASREIAISSAGATAGTTLNINNAHHLIEVGGVVSTAAHTIEEEANVTLKLTCTVWQPVQEVKVLFEPCGAISDQTVDENSPMTYLARRIQRLLFTADRASILAEFDLSVALSNAGQACHYIRWI